MIIGIPKEILDSEQRVAAIPETVTKLIAMGFEVHIEKGAGAGVFIDDSLYQQAGATMAQDAAALYGRAELVLKVKQPVFNRQLGKHEIQLMNAGTMLITFLHPAAPAHHEMVSLLMQRNITSFTMDSIPRISRAQSMDALTSMSTVTGYKAVIMAANHLPVFVPMMSTAIGMLKPARFLIIGCGVVGLQAIAAAKRLGGVLNTVDIRPEAREEAKSLGAKVAGFEVAPEQAKGPGGYARTLSVELLEQERAHLAPLVADADVVITSALVPGEVAPLLVSSGMARQMRPGSVIVDVAIDQGGNCELTRPGEVVHTQGLTVIGTQNIPGSMAVHSTQMYAKNMLSYLQNMFKKEGRQVDWEDEIVRSTVVTHQGKLVHAGTMKSWETMRAS